MRDPKRIDHILASLQRVWLKNPDLRLAQLLVIAAQPREPCPQIFYADDEAFLEGLLKYEEQRSRVE